MRELTASAGALLFACAWLAPVLADPLPLKESPVRGWPALQIETHYVPRIVMRGRCLAAPAGKPIPETDLNSCARPDFWRGVCDIYIDVSHVGNAALQRYEQQRCRGHDRRNNTDFAEALRAWRAHGENRYADMVEFAALMYAWGRPRDCGEDGVVCIDAP